MLKRFFNIFIQKPAQELQEDKRAWLKDINDKNCGLHDLRDIRYVTMICNYQLVRELEGFKCSGLRGQRPDFLLLEQIVDRIADAVREIRHYMIRSAHRIRQIRLRRM